MPKGAAGDDDRRGRGEMYGVDGDGMRPRPLLGMANLEKRPSLKRGESLDRVVVAKRSPTSPQPVKEDDECEPDYDSNSDSYEPDYDDTLDDLSQKDNSRGISSEGLVWKRRRGEDEKVRSVNMEVEEISTNRQVQQAEDRRGSQLDVGRQQTKGRGRENQMSAVVGRAIQETRVDPQERESSSIRMEGENWRGPATSVTRIRSSGVSKRPPPAIKSSEEIFREAIEHRIRHKNIPIPLSEKRRLMKKIRTQFSVVSHVTDETPALVRSGGAGFTRFLRKLGDLWSLVEPWAKTLKKIEGTSGSGVASYFRLLRTLLYLNFVVALIFLVFIILPTAGKPSTNQTFHIADIFLGTGPLQDSILFYGAYTKTTSAFPWSGFDIPSGYFYAVFVSYLVYLLSLMVNMVSAVRKSFIDSAEIEGKKFGPALFTSWEMTIEDSISAKQLMNKICMDLTKLLKRKRTRMPVTKSRLFVRILTFVGVLVIFICIGYLLYFLLQSDNIDQKIFVWIVPALISTLIFLLPWFLRTINLVEGYGSRHNLYLRLFQTFLLATFLLTLLRVTHMLPSNSEQLLQTTCRETSFGQEMYRLIIFYFFFVVLLNFLADTILSRMSATPPQFDISSNTTDLIYIQMAACFGALYSPLLPLITTCIFILVFYIQLISLKLNFSESKKTWTTSTTRTVYLILTFLAIAIPFAFFFYYITLMKSNCGPFSSVPNPIDVTGLTTSMGDRTYVSYWIFSKGVWALITVATAIFFYYSFSSARATRKLGKELLRELQGEVKELRVLQKAAAGLIKRDTNAFL